MSVLNGLTSYALAAFLISLGAQAFAQGDNPDPDLSIRDEATLACPEDLKDADPSARWWCDHDIENVTQEGLDGKEKLLVFREHPYANIATVPTKDSLDLDWTCIDGRCGGLLDPDFIKNRDLTHISGSASSGLGTIKMTEERRKRAVKGRNSWLLWSGGNHAFWDYLAREGYGLADFMKLLDNRTVAREDRFRKLGFINEPGMEASTSPDKWGLMLDAPSGWKGVWPPEPGTKTLPKEVPDPYVYGYSSGIMGMRLYPNPEFFYGKKAKRSQRDWDPKRFMSDQNYAKDPELVRPYRVGMTCGFCHTSFNPVNPPKNTAEPQWANISSSVGAQYLKFGRAAAYDFDPSNVLWHLVNYGRPGTIDTSLVATDGINNPNVANGVFGLLPRLVNSKHFEERVRKQTERQSVLDLSVLGLDLPPLPGGDTRLTMHVLGGGEDAAGGRLALARVYLNIGVFHEYWRKTANLLIGMAPQKPFSLDALDANSVYWKVTMFRAQNMAEFLTYNSGPMKLKDAPQGKGYVSANPSVLARGKKHFVENCMVCHSTKQPDMFWSAPKDWKKWINDPAYLQQAAAIAQDPDFTNGNFLSTDVRYPAPEIGINLKRFLNDNSKEGHVWSDFTSIEYQTQPTLKQIVPVAHPYDDTKTVAYKFANNTGPARVRPLALNNMWATAPYLHNNMVGHFPYGKDPANYLAEEGADPSTAGRMEVFNTSIEELLHLRERKNYRSIIRTTVDSQIVVPRVVAIDFIRQQIGGHVLGLLAIGMILIMAVGFAMIYFGLRKLQYAGWGRLPAALSCIVGFFLIILMVHTGIRTEHRIGHIPAGTPVSLIVNLNGPDWLHKADPDTVKAVLWDIAKVTFYKLPSLDHPDVPDLVKNLMAINKAPDLVLDKGHHFGGKDIRDASGSVIMPALSEVERRELIEYLKTL